MARSLFDWTIRNIQSDYVDPKHDDPDSGDPDHVPQVPWETLFLGHGTPLERAWTYILLLRQRGIDAALLVPGEDSAATGKSPPTQAKPESPRPWCVGVLIGDKEKKLYLFDFRLALPIPRPDGIAADKSGRLDVQPATLDQVGANPKLLDRLALAADAPYWARHADLKRAVALVEASPLYVSPRAKRVEQRLTGEQRLVLNAEPSQQAARFKAAGVGDVRLWDLPYTTLKRRLDLGPDAVFAASPGLCAVHEQPRAAQCAPLYKGRILHLKGRFFDEKEAIAYYQRARPRTSVVCGRHAENRGGLFSNSLPQQRKARGGDLTPAEERMLKQGPPCRPSSWLEAIIAGKLAASYWLGLIEYEQGNCYEQGESAARGLVRPWTTSVSARCNSARRSFGPPGRITTSPAVMKPAGSGRRQSTSTSPASSCRTTRETWFAPAG